MNIEIFLIVLFSVSALIYSYRMSPEVIPRENELELAKASEVENQVIEVFEVPDFEDYRIVIQNSDFTPNYDFGQYVHSVPNQILKSLFAAEGISNAALEFGSATGKLVRLTNESTRDFNTLKKTYDSAGNIIGTFRNENGKIASLVKFRPATVVQATSALSNIVTAAAMQAQLASIENAIREVGMQVEHLQVSFDNLIESQRLGLEFVLNETYEAAYSTGVMTQNMWEQISGLGFHTASHLAYARLQIESTIKEIGSRKSTKDKRKYLEKYAGNVISNFHILRKTEQLQIQYSILRIQHLISTKDPSLNHYISVIRTNNEKSRDLENQLLTALESSIEKSRPSSISRLISPFDSKQVRRIQKRILSGLSDFQQIKVQNDELE